MAKHTEATELIAAAVEAIQAALTLGDEQGHKERWREQPHEVHLIHGHEHLKTAYTLGELADRRQNAQQALCRLAMALVMMK